MYEYSLSHTRKHSMMQSVSMLCLYAFGGCVWMSTGKCSVTVRATVSHWSHNTTGKAWDLTHMQLQ